jgi:hypothetical protein
MKKIKDIHSNKKFKKLNEYTDTEGKEPGCFYTR